MSSINKLLLILICFTNSISYSVTVLVKDSMAASELGLEREDRTSIWWAYNIISVLLLTMSLMMNAAFPIFAMWDSRRKIYLMQLISRSLELDFVTKDTVSIRLPTLNFLDKQSLLTWLKARKLVIETGIRYQNRLQIIVCGPREIRTACMAQQHSKAGSDIGKELRGGMAFVPLALARVQSVAVPA